MGLLKGAMLGLSSALLFCCAGGPKVKSAFKPGITLTRSSSISVIPSKIGGRDDLVLPDALTTELLGMGFNVIERTRLTQLVEERGFNFTEILNGEEYLKLGELTDVDALAVVTASLRGGGVANATVRLIRLPEGEIIASISYSQPAPDSPSYARHDSLLRTAEKLAREVRRAISY